MNVDSIRKELAARLGLLGLQGYPELPAQPEFPCAVVSMPVVTNYHRTQLGQGATSLEVECRVFVGRGEINDAQVELGKYVSNDTAESVVLALEAKGDVPWLRLVVTRTSEMIRDGDAFGVIFYTEIDA